MFKNLCNNIGLSALAAGLHCLVMAGSLSAFEINQPPVIQFFQGDLGVMGRNLFILGATITDDGIPERFNKSFSWRFVSGPEVVSPRPGWAPMTSVRLTTPGKYFYSLVVNDGQLSSEQTVCIHYQSNGSSSIHVQNEHVAQIFEAKEFWNAFRSTELDAISGPMPSAKIGFIESDFHLDSDSEVFITFLNEGTSKPGHLGWYDARFPDEKFLIWNDYSRDGFSSLSGSEVDYGSKVSLGCLPAGTDLRFFITRDYDNGRHFCFTMDQELNPDRQQHVASIFDFQSENSFTHILGFESQIFGGDKSFSDLFIRVDIVPESETVTYYGSDDNAAPGISENTGTSATGSQLHDLGMDASVYELDSQVFYFPEGDTTYQFKLLRDISNMKFSLGVFDVDSMPVFEPGRLEFRKLAIENSVLILDDRVVDPGGVVEFTPSDYGLDGRRVAFSFIPNNLPQVFLRNSFRYSPLGNGTNTKRQPLFSIASANPGSLDQLLVFGSHDLMMLSFEQHSRVTDSIEKGDLSDNSFDDVQISISPAPYPADLYEDYFSGSKPYDRTGLSYLRSKVMDILTVVRNNKGYKNALVAEASLTTLVNATLINEFGESLPIDSSGALGLNIDYQYGARSDYFIELQRYGADLIETGYITGDMNLVEDGISMIDWGFSQQQKNGSFPKSGDILHSSFLFLEAASRAGLNLFNYDKINHRETIQRWKISVKACLQWITDPVNADSGIVNNLVPFSHRYFQRANAILSAAEFINEGRRYQSHAESYIKRGFAAQAFDGTFPERGSYDLSYQAYGLSQLAKSWTYISDSSLKSQVEVRLRSAINRFFESILPSGEIVIPEDSRTATEVSRNGNPKRFDFKSMARCLALSYEILDWELCADQARLTLTYAGIIKPSGAI